MANVMGLINAEQTRPELLAQAILPHAVKILDKVMNGTVEVPWCCSEDQQRLLQRMYRNRLYFTMREMTDHPVLKFIHDQYVDDIRRYIAGLKNVLCIGSTLSELCDLIRPVEDGRNPDGSIKYKRVPKLYAIYAHMNAADVARFSNDEMLAKKIIGNGTSDPRFGLAKEFLDYLMRGQTFVKGSRFLNYGAVEDFDVAFDAGVCIDALFHIPPVVLASIMAKHRVNVCTATMILCPEMDYADHYHNPNLEIIFMRTKTDVIMAHDKGASNGYYQDKDIFMQWNRASVFTSDYGVLLMEIVTNQYGYVRMTLHRTPTAPFKVVRRSLALSGDNIAIPDVKHYLRYWGNNGPTPYVYTDADKYKGLLDYMAGAAVAKFELSTFYTYMRGMMSKLVVGGQELVKSWEIREGEAQMIMRCALLESALIRKDLFDHLSTSVMVAKKDGLKPYFSFIKGVGNQVKDWFYRLNERKILNWIHEQKYRAPAYIFDCSKNQLIDDVAKYAKQFIGEEANYNWKHPNLVVPSSGINRIAVAYYAPRYRSMSTTDVNTSGEKFKQLVQLYNIEYLRFHDLSAYPGGAVIKLLELEPNSSAVISSNPYGFRAYEALKSDRVTDLTRTTAFGHTTLHYDEVLAFHQSYSPPDLFLCDMASLEKDHWTAFKIMTQCTDSTTNLLIKMFPNDHVTRDILWVGLQAFDTVNYCRAEASADDSDEFYLRLASARMHDLKAIIADNYPIDNTRDKEITYIINCMAEKSRQLHLASLSPLPVTTAVIAPAVVPVVAAPVAVVNPKLEINVPPRDSAVITAYPFYEQFSKCEGPDIELKVNELYTLDGNLNSVIKTIRLLHECSTDPDNFYFDLQWALVAVFVLRYSVLPNFKSNYHKYFLDYRKHIMLGQALFQLKKSRIYQFSSFIKEAIETDLEKMAEAFCRLNQKFVSWLSNYSDGIIENADMLEQLNRLNMDDVAEAELPPPIVQRPLPKLPEDQLAVPTTPEDRDEWSMTRTFPALYCRAYPLFKSKPVVPPKPQIPLTLLDPGKVFKFKPLVPAKPVVDWTGYQLNYRPMTKKEKKLNEKLVRRAFQQDSLNFLARVNGYTEKPDDIIEPQLKLPDARGHLKASHQQTVVGTKLASHRHVVEQAKSVIQKENCSTYFSHEKAKAGSKFPIDQVGAVTLLEEIQQDFWIRSGTVDEYQELHTKVRDVCKTVIPLTDYSKMDVEVVDGVFGFGKTQAIAELFDNARNLYIVHTSEGLAEFRERLKQVKHVRANIAGRTFVSVLTEKWGSVSDVYIDEAFALPISYFVLLMTIIPGAKFHLYGDSEQTQYLDQYGYLSPNQALKHHMDLFPNRTRNYQTYRCGPRISILMKTLNYQVIPNLKRDTKYTIGQPVEKADLNIVLGSPLSKVLTQKRVQNMTAKASQGRSVKIVNFYLAKSDTIGMHALGKVRELMIVAMSRASDQLNIVEEELGLFAKLGFPDPGQVESLSQQLTGVISVPSTWVTVEKTVKNIPLPDQTRTSPVKYDPEGVSAIIGVKNNAYVASFMMTPDSNKVKPTPVKMTFNPDKFAEVRQSEEQVSTMDRYGKSFKVADQRATLYTVIKRQQVAQNKGKKLDLHIAADFANNFWEKAIDHKKFNISLAEFQETWEANMRAIHKKYAASKALKTMAEIIDDTSIYFRNHLKQIQKPKDDPEAPFKDVGGQPIDALAKEISVAYSVYFRTVTKLLIKALKPRFKVANGTNDSDIEAFLKKYDEEPGQWLINDMSEYDASQNINTAEMEMLIYEKVLGTPLSQNGLRLYRLIRKDTVVYGALFALMNGTKKPSGAPDTLLGNTLLNICLLCYIIPMTLLICLCAIGDDSAVKLKQSRENWQLRFKSINKFVLMDSKLFLVDTLEFCSHIFHKGCYFFNPVLLAKKIHTRSYYLDGRTLLTKNDFFKSGVDSQAKIVSFKAYQESLKDLIKVIASRNNLDKVIEGTVSYYRSVGIHYDYKNILLLLDYIIAFVDLEWKDYEKHLMRVDVPRL